MVDDSLSKTAEDFTEDSISSSESNANFFTTHTFYSTTEAGEQLSMSPEMIRYYVKNFPELFPDVRIETPKTPGRQGKMWLSNVHIDMIGKIVALKKEKYSKEEIIAELQAPLTGEIASPYIDELLFQKNIQSKKIQEMLKIAYEYGVKSTVEATNSYLKERDILFAEKLETLENHLQLALDDKNERNEALKKIESLTSELDESQRFSNSLSSQLIEVEKEKASEMKENELLRTEIAELKTKLEEATKKKGFLGLFRH